MEIATFRFDHRDVEAALKAAAQRGVKVTALIAFDNRGGEQRLRRLEVPCLAAGITRTIIRDRQAFVGSQSLRAEELDSRRELGLIVKDARAVKALIETFESDWVGGKVRTIEPGAQEPAHRPNRGQARQRRRRKPSRCSRRNWFRSPTA